MSEPVLFCYSDYDRRIVSPMLDELERLDIDFRFCYTRLPPHEDNSAPYLQRENIESSKLMVVFLTDGVIISSVIMWQIQLAISYGLDTVVVRLTSNEPAESLRDALESAHWIDALDRPQEDVTSQLVDVVCAKLGLDPHAPKASSALPKKASTGTVEEHIAAMRKELAEVPPAPSFMGGSEPVLFCYSEFDSQIVRPMLDELERLDIDSRKCFTHVPPHEGNAIEDILRWYIETSKLMVVFLTDGVVYSVLATWQIQMACSYGLDAVVVRLTSSEPEESLRDALEPACWIDALDRPLEDVTSQLVDVVCAKLGLDPNAPKASSALPDVAFTGTVDEKIAAMRKILTEEPPASSES